jgi:hypothetical protein
MSGINGRYGIVQNGNHVLKPGLGAGRRFGGMRPLHSISFCFGLGSLCREVG